MDIEQRVETLLSQLTLKEKISLLSGKDIWNTVPIERLGIPSIMMTDGPHGVRASNPEVGRQVGPTTAFPTGIAMGASWNPALIERVGQALGEETRGMGCDVLLSPCVNIMRYPLGGRNFETYAEDPYLAGRTAVAYINGVQSRGVGTSLKHYALNNYEIERFRASTRVDERTMREIYLPAFEMAVKDARPWTVMCAYNRINGVYASEHEYLLKTILKNEWGFEGAVISDWGAVHSVFASIQNGLDLEMPGPVKYYKLLHEAVDNWQIDEAAITEAARRVLRLIARTGQLDGTVSVGAVNTPEHQALARALAEDSITLLKNDDGVLPLLPEKLKTIAVIGPNALPAVIEGGGSSKVEPPYRVAPLEALQARLGSSVTIEYERGCDNYDVPFDVAHEWLGENGLTGAFFAAADFSGEPVFTKDRYWPEFWFHTAWSPMPVPPLAVRWEGRLTVPATGTYRFNLIHSGTMRVFVNDEQLLDHTAASGFFGAQPAQALRTLNAGETVTLRLEYVRDPQDEIIFYKLGLGLHFEPGQDPRFDRALALAQKADVVLFFGGMPEAYESEGYDLAHMNLPGGQNALIAALVKANPKTVVVLNNGIPVTMPWADAVPAIVEAFYPGQENGHAVTRILLGEVNPSGKLPVTFPKRLQDSPAHINASYPGAREVNYGEGIFVGYRYFDKVDLEPLFPFGHGLSYTTFAYSDLKVAASVQPGAPIEVAVTVTNTGPRAGQEVVQIYISDSQSALPRPPKELKAFTKVALEPGASETVTFTLPPRALMFYDPHFKHWVAEPGEFTVLAASSSRDVRLRATFNLAK